MICATPLRCFARASEGTERMDRWDIQTANGLLYGPGQSELVAQG